jgi:non-heme chloroperoxidase
MPFSRFTRHLWRLFILSLLACVTTLACADARHYTATAPDGVVLQVQESGNPQGPAIIFIHGLLGSHLNWQAQTNSALLQRYRMITYDMRGHGLSDKPSAAEAYSEGNRWADDLNAVMQAAKVSRPVLAGWSLGGMVISNYLTRYGDTHIAGAMYIDGVIELNAEQITPHPQVYRDLNAKDLKTHLDTVRQFVSLCFHVQPDRQTFERLLASAAMASWDMQQHVQSMTVDVSKGLAQAKVPLLLLYGARDALIKPAPTIARARQLNPRVTSKLYADSGHAPFVEEPERFNRDLAAFVDSTSGR